MRRGAGASHLLAVRVGPWRQERGGSRAQNAKSHRPEGIGRWLMGKAADSWRGLRARLGQSGRGQRDRRKPRQKILHTVAARQCDPAPWDGVEHRPNRGTGVGRRSNSRRHTRRAAPAGCLPASALTRQPASATAALQHPGHRHGHRHRGQQHQQTKDEAADQNADVGTGADHVGRLGLLELLGAEEQHLRL